MSAGITSYLASVVESLPVEVQIPIIYTTAVIAIGGTAFVAFSSIHDAYQFCKKNLRGRRFAHIVHDNDSDVEVS